MRKFLALSALILGLMVFATASINVTQAEECCPAPVEPAPPSGD